MTRFLKVNSDEGDMLLVNIERIRYFEPRSLGQGVIINFESDYWIAVSESMDTIIEMIEQEEVVK